MFLKRPWGTSPVVQWLRLCPPSARGPGLIPGQRTSREGNGTPLQYSCLKNPMGGGAWSLRVGHDWVTSLSLFTFMHWRREWQPTPVFLPGESHGQRSLVGCSPWGREELGTTEWLHFHFSLSCIGEGNGNPLQCSCLENPRDGRAWWAAIYGVTQSRTQLKQLSSSSSSRELDPESKIYGFHLSIQI